VPMMYMHFSIQELYDLQYIYFAEFTGKNILFLDLDGYNVICMFRDWHKSKFNNFLIKKFLVISLFYFTMCHRYHLLLFM
jgi:hypothetical protein